MFTFFNAVHFKFKCYSQDSYWKVCTSEQIFFLKLEETKLGFFVILLLNSLLRISNYFRQLSFISSIFWLVMKINGN